jgi:phosphoserine aminotransferase
VAAHDLIYAGAQKNLGPSGLTVVIARKTFIERAGAGLPALLRYQTYARERSLHNTPNTFAIYVIAEVLAWIAEQGGLAGMAALSEAKATRLYAAIDGSPHLRGPTPEPGSRSRMNVTFRATTPRSRRRCWPTPRPPACRACAVTARWVACAPASTTRCRWRAWSAWSR